MDGELEYLEVKYMGINEDQKHHVYHVMLKADKDNVGTIFISNDKNHALSFEFKNDMYVVDACKIILDEFLKNEEYITFSTNVMNRELKAKLRAIGMRYKYSYRSDDDYRMYQYSSKEYGTYTGYWDQYKHYIESSELR